MAILLRLSSRIRPISATELCLKTSTINSLYRPTRKIFSKPEFLIPSLPFTVISTTRKKNSSFSTAIAGWLMGLGEKKKPSLPEIVKAGDPVLHEPARKVGPEEIVSERIQKVIHDMIKVMKFAPGVGLAAPQIGIPLRVIVNPELKKKGNKTALFFEGCLR